MKIAIVLPYLRRRGTEKQALRLAIGLRKKGWDPVIFNIQGWGEMEYDFLDQGIQVVKVGPEIDPELRSIDYGRTESLVQLIREYKSDIILSRANLSHKISILAKKQLKIPLVLVKSSAINPISRNYYVRLKQLMKYHIDYKSVDKIVTVSESSCGYLRQYFPFQSNKIMSIQNGIEIENIRSLSLHSAKVDFEKDKFNLCFVGSLMHRKGLDILFHSLNKLVRDYNKKNIILHIVGTGEDSNEILKLVKDLSLDDYVEFHGEQKNPYPFIKKSNLLVLPSRREGLPNILLEAMSIGTCCLATDCHTGPSEIIEHGKNGLLVPTENPSMMADEILRIMDDEETRSKLEQNALQTIKARFSIDRMIDSYHKSLCGLIN